MKIVCISDTHMQHWHLKVPEGDVLVHAGDALIGGRQKEWVDFVAWWNEQPHPNKVFVPGNHDRVCEEMPDWARSGLKDTNFLVDEGCRIKGVQFWGTPWQRPFHDWAFNQGDAFRAEKFANIPANTAFLVSHAPPFGYQDVVAGEHEHLGDEELVRVTNAIMPAFHAFGHIHSGYGVGQRWVYRDGDRSDVTVLLNASICNEGYKPVNAPLVVHI